MNIVNFRPRPKQTALLPLSDDMRRATLTSYVAGGITPQCATERLIKLGMKAEDAAREVADAIQF